VHDDYLHMCINAQCTVHTVVYPLLLCLWQSYRIKYTVIYVIFTSLIMRWFITMKNVRDVQ
jgi:hypothetical protein